MHAWAMKIILLRCTKHAFSTCDQNPQQSRCKSSDIAIIAILPDLSILSVAALCTCNAMRFVALEFLILFCLNPIMHTW